MHSAQVLSSLGQSSMLHLRGDLISPERISRALQALQVRLNPCNFRAPVNMICPYCFSSRVSSDDAVWQSTLLGSTAPSFL